MSYQQNFIQPNDIVKVTTKGGKEYTGALSYLFSIDVNNMSLEIMILQHDLHNGEDFGAVAFNTSEIEKIEPLIQYNRFQERQQERAAFDAKKVENFMKSRNMPIEDIAAYTSLTIEKIRTILKKDASKVSLKDALVIARALNVYIEDLL